MSVPKIIAFYLPQYHPTADNNAWWGKGFTEWTNVGKARSLFPGHDQPRIPADLGYYDLRLPETRQAQADLAEKHGIYGFCYYHYYFGNGRMELERPFQEVLKSHVPTFPFCLAWANESWYMKNWNIDSVDSKKLLVEQTYQGEEDYIRHFDIVLPAFKDPRYIRIDDKPVFVIYRPRKFPDVENFIKRWQGMARQNDLPGIHFIAQSTGDDNEIDAYLSQGFDAVNTVRLHEYDKQMPWYGKLRVKLLNRLLGFPKMISYRKAQEYFVTDRDHEENIYPSIISGWDHTPRSGRNGSVMIDYTPGTFDMHVRKAVECVRNKKEQNQIIFLKSWNEWGEGNYVEPDLKHGTKFLDVINANLNSFRT